MTQSGGLYIHVPFCQSRCTYCDFYSTTATGEWRSQYVNAAVRELQRRREELPRAHANTIYIGGGTPSLLTPQQLQQLLRAATDNLDVSPDAEVTVEANPDDIRPEWLEALHDTPVNRLSMGLQSLDDRVLSTLHRRHTAQQALEAVQMCLHAGYENISVDLIYGLPGQTLEMWQQDVQRVLSLGMPHLSCYALQLEEGTRMMREFREGRLHEADEELSLKMYEYLMDATAQAGMEHYEISNFCRPGWKSRHNSSYWDQSPYLGIGPGAHSYDGHRIRRWNEPQLRPYVEAMEDVPHGSETLSDQELYDERIMTRLRTHEGLPILCLNEVERKYCLEMAAPHLKSGKMELQDGFLRLTRKGIFVSDDLMSDLMR